MGQSPDKKNPSPSPIAAQVQSPNAVRPPVPRFFVVIDPGHGGSDNGARFTDKLFEKDITLALARKLRTELQNRGIAAVLLRDSDATITYDQRAVTTNAQHASLYVGLHVGWPGAGVRVYSAMMPSTGKTEGRGPFIPWNSAQAGHLQASHTVADGLVSAFGVAKIRCSAADAPLLPLKSIAAPAVAIEMAPPTLESKPETLGSARYLQAVATAAAAGIAEVRGKIEERQP